MNSFFRVSDPAALVGRSPAPRLTPAGEWRGSIWHASTAWRPGTIGGSKPPRPGFFLSGNTVTENKTSTLPASAAHHRRSRRKVTTREREDAPEARFMVGGGRPKADHVGLLAKILHITETNSNTLR